MEAEICEVLVDLGKVQKRNAAGVSKRAVIRINKEFKPTKSDEIESTSSLSARIYKF